MRHVVEALHIPKLVSATINDCESLLHRIKSDSFPTRDTLRNLDQISNKLCLSIDPLSALSNIHSDKSFQEEAAKGVEELQMYCIFFYKPYSYKK